MKRFKNITTAYLAHKEMAVKATSLNNYRQILRNHLLPEFGEKKEISEDDEREVLPADNIWTDDGVHPKVAYQKKMGDLATRILAETMV